MQLHVPQDYATAYEVEELMGVNKHIVSSQANKPIMGAVQDTTLGVFILTQPDTILTRAQFMDCVYSAGKRCVKRYKKMEKNNYSGKLLFSVLLPEDFHYKNAEITIVNGELIGGVVTNKSIGRSYYSIAHRLYKEYSHTLAADFLTELQFLINR